MEDIDQEAFEKEIQAFQAQRKASEATLLDDGEQDDEAGDGGAAAYEDDGSVGSAVSNFFNQVGQSVTAALGFADLQVLEEQGLLLDVATTHKEEILLVNTPKGSTHFSCPKTLPHPSLWPNEILMRETQCHKGWSAESIAAPVPTDGQAFEFETANFKGRLMVRLRTLPSAASYFQGRARLNSCVVCGQFKEDFTFNEVQTGQEFCQPIRQPSAFLTRAVLKFFRVLAPLLQAHIGKQSYFLSPLAQTAQIIHVSDEPVELTPDLEVEENLAQFEIGRVLDQFQRKKYFSNKKNLEGRTFKKDKFYTFDFYNDKLDMETFKLHVLGQQFSVQKYINAQPLRVLTRLQRQGDPIEHYLWNFEIWNSSVTEYLSDQPMQCCE